MCTAPAPTDILKACSAVQLPTAPRRANASRGKPRETAGRAHVQVEEEREGVEDDNLGYGPGSYLPRLGT